MTFPTIFFRILAWIVALAFVAPCALFAPHRMIILPVYLLLSGIIIHWIDLDPPPVGAVIAPPVMFDKTFHVRAFRINPLHPVSRITKTSRSSSRHPGIFDQGGTGIREDYYEETNTAAVPQYQLTFSFRAYGIIPAARVPDVETDVQRGLAIWKLKYLTPEDARRAIQTIDRRLTEHLKHVGLDLKVKLITAEIDDLVATPGSAKSDHVLIQLV